MAGAKSKYDTYIKSKFDEIEGLLNGGASEKQVAKSLGVSYATWNNYKNQYEEFRELCNKPRTKLIEDLRSALVKKALGFQYEEKESYIKQEVETDPVTKETKPVGPKFMHTKILTRYQPPDTTAIFGALNIYDEDYVKDKKNYELKQQELELRKLQAEIKDW